MKKSEQNAFCSWMLVNFIYLEFIIVISLMGCFQKIFTTSEYDET